MVAAGSSRSGAGQSSARTSSHTPCDSLMHRLCTASQPFFSRFATCAGGLRRTSVRGPIPLLYSPRAAAPLRAGSPSPHLPPNAAPRGADCPCRDRGPSTHIWTAIQAEPAPSGRRPTPTTSGSRPCALSASTAHAARHRAPARGCAPGSAAALRARPAGRRGRGRSARRATVDGRSDGHQRDQRRAGGAGRRPAPRAAA